MSYAARFSLIGCVTPLTLVQHHRYMNMIGARFLSYRVAELDEKEVDRGFDTVWNGGAEFKAEVRHLASAYATQLHHQLSQGALVLPQCSDQAKEKLNSLAKFLACARAAVRTQRADITNKDGKTSTVYDIVEVQREEPFRALLQLRVLALALAIVHRRKEVTEHELELCRRVVLSSMPYDRSLVLALFRNPTPLTQNSGLTRKAAAEGIGKARNQAVRLLTELEAIGVLSGEKTHDDAQDVDVWTYFPASDGFGEILSKPTEPLNHAEEKNNSFAPDVVLCQGGITQNYVRDTKENSEFADSSVSDGDSIVSPYGQPAASAGIPFMITHAHRQKLYNLGYEVAEIDRMTPAEAQAIVAEFDRVLSCPGCGREWPAYAECCGEILHQAHRRLQL